VIVVVLLAFLFRPVLPPPKVTGSAQVSNDGGTKAMMVIYGSRIYFSSCSGYGCALYEVSTAGGGTVPVQTPIPNPIVVDISPDRSQLLIASCTALYENDCTLWLFPS
jgi:hypothetical protein